MLGLPELATSPPPIPNNNKKHTYIKKIICCSSEIQFDVLYFIWQPEQWGLRHCRWNPGPILEELHTSRFTPWAGLPVLLPRCGGTDSRVVTSHGLFVSLTLPLPLD